WRADAVGRRTALRPCHRRTAGAQPLRAQNMPQTAGRKKSRAGARLSLRFFMSESLHRLDVAGLLALGSRRYFERNFLSFLERLEALHVDRREVRKQVFTTAIGRDKAKALRVVKPLHCSSCHCW